MYKTFYKLDRKPFEILPDNSFLWLGENHKEALSTLRYGVLDNKGFLLLTGEAGLGKTSLIKALTKSFDSEVIWAVIDNPILERIDFYNEIARNFGIDKKFTSKVQFLIQFSHFLHKADDENKKVLLLVDECHLLSQEMLEELRLLANIEKADAKLINIFFVGEQSFNELLGQPKNRAVRQRLTLTAELPKLTAHEAEDYIRHRVEVAGAEDKIFTAKACQSVHKYSGGVPLEINKICDAALKLGAQEQVESISPELIDRALNKVDAADVAASSVQEPAPPVEKAPVQKDYSQFRLGDSPDSQITGFNVEADRKPAWLKFGLAALVVIGVGAYFFSSPEAPVVPESPSVASSVVVEKPAIEEAPIELSKVSISPVVTVLEENGEVINKVKVEELKTAILEKAYEGETPVEAEVVEETPVAVDDSALVETGASEQEIKEQVAEVAKAAQEESEPVEEVTPVVAEVKPVEAPAPELVESVPVAQVEEDVIKDIIPEPEPQVEKVRLEPRKVLLPLRPNSLKLTKSGTKAFDEFVEKLLNYPKATILIKGFVSSKSNSPENIKLSEDRALTVYKMMLQRGVDPEQIEMEGMGNREPIASNDTRAGRTKNRRVEILVIRDGLE